MGTETNKHEDRNSPEYLAQLLKDKKQIQAFPSVFVHLERLLDEEIGKVRANLFHLGVKKEPLTLPDADGSIVQLSEKLYVPVNEHPEFNFVGRILGPRGMTAKSLEQDTGCKIMVRGKGSMRDKKKEELNRGKPNWEHLKEDLHVLITVEDTKNRGLLKLARAVEEVKRLLVPAPEGEDALKKIQLMELAIMNGTYRDVNRLQVQQLTAAHHARLQAAAGLHGLHGLQGLAQMPAALRSPSATGTPIVFAAPRMPTGAISPPTSIGSPVLQHAGSMPPPLVSPTDGTIMYQYADPFAQLASAPLMDYQTALEQSAAGMSSYVR